MSKTEQLIADYKAVASTLTEREKAQREAEIWDAATVEGKRGSNDLRDQYLSRELGESRYHYHSRCSLLNAGADADLLWERVMNDKMPVRSALNLFRQARQAAYERKVPYARALADILAEYDKGTVSVLPSGKVFRRSGTAKKAEKKPQAAEPEPVAAKSPRDTWQAIRQIFTQMLDARMKDVDPSFSESLRQEFMSDLQALFTVYQNRIKRVIATNKGMTMSVGITIDMVNDALLTLNLDPLNRLGETVNAQLIKKSFRSMVKQYHPDHNGGNEAMRRNFEAVQKAYEILEEYQSLYGENAQCHASPRMS